MGALSEEIDCVLPLLSNITKTTCGSREYYQGNFNENPVVAVYSRMGKVAASITATTLIKDFQVKSIIFTGVAGSADSKVKIGDVVVGTYLYQHDMDARPLYPQHQIPMLGTDKIFTDKELTYKLMSSAEKFVPNRIHNGPIASGDKFFASKEEIKDLKVRLPDVMCVEMEGAAVAQVCYEHKVPFAIFRTISDSADEKSPKDFSQFVKEVASKYSVGILSNFFNKE